MFDVNLFSTVKLGWHFRFSISWPSTQRFSWIISLIISFPPYFLTISFLNYYFSISGPLGFPLVSFLFYFLSLCLLLYFLWDFLKFTYQSCYYFIMLSYLKWYFQELFFCPLYYPGLSLWLQLSLSSFC